MLLALGARRFSMAEMLPGTQVIDTRQGDPPLRFTVGADQ
jgi:hypothetical protein